jgi:hypothetical protein
LLEEAVPFGYSVDPKSRQPAPVEHEGSILREMFELVAAGVLPSEGASIADEKAWRTRTRRPWTARQVLDTVTNPVYAGRFRAPDGTRPGAHEAIVRQDIFDQCARLIAGQRTPGLGCAVAGNGRRLSGCLQILRPRERWIA